MNTSLMFLSPSDRAKVWSAVDRGEIPYPHNGLVPTMLVDRALCITLLDKELVNPSKCTCHKPFGGRVVKCEYCRVKDIETLRYQAPTKTDGGANKQPPPATEYRRWKCDDQKCPIQTSIWKSDKHPEAFMQVGRRGTCCANHQCTVIRCHADGTPIAAKRYFKSADQFGTWIRKFCEGNSFLTFVGATAGWTDEGTLFNPDNMAVIDNYEITESEAEALLGKSDA